VQCVFPFAGSLRRVVIDDSDSDDGVFNTAVVRLSARSATSGPLRRQASKMDIFEQFVFERTYFGEFKNQFLERYNVFATRCEFWNDFTISLNWLVASRSATLANGN